MEIGSCVYLPPFMNGGRRIQNLVKQLPNSRAALAYAERQHTGQRRAADGAPFIEHPLEVALLLYDAGAPDHVIAAGLLHDTIEKTSTSAADLRERFGPEIADLVVAVSEDESVAGFQRRKAALRRRVAVGGPDALMVFAADKISKTRELRLEASPAANESPPNHPPTRAARRTRGRRLDHYERSLELLERFQPDSRLVAQLRAELDSLFRDAQPAAPARPTRLTPQPQA
jgi:hypothetical protein